MGTLALLDCNSFYASCERAFRPDLAGQPIVVLSNNDGCVIARSQEARARGIAMGAPWHLIRNTPACRGVHWFSSNYALYADMSRRVHSVLCARAPGVEAYSIDEMFMDFAGLPQDPVDLARSIRHEVASVTKVPTCVGLGPTKTIAKLANRVAKADPALDGVCDLRHETDRMRTYASEAVGTVWGIGPRIAARLQAAGIRTVADFVAMDPARVRRMLTVTGARTQAELQGTACLPFGGPPAQRKGIAVTRSFGRPLEDLPDISEAVTFFATRAAERLRGEHLEAGQLTVFVHTARHAPGAAAQGEMSASMERTSDTTVLVREATRMLAEIWRPGHAYAKAGVQLDDLWPAGEQASMLGSAAPGGRGTRAMAALDALNARFGRETVRMAGSGIDRAWTPRAANRSPRYTTRLEEIPTVHARGG